MSIVIVGKEEIGVVKVRKGQKAVGGCLLFCGDHQGSRNDNVTSGRV